jgi:hypothetical protein
VAAATDDSRRPAAKEAQVNDADERPGGHDGSQPQPAGSPAPDTGDDILVTIRALLPNLAPVEQRVARQVLADPFGTAMQPISELAGLCGTSATTVIRFCRAVGLRGYPELRIALAAASAQAGRTAGVEPSHRRSPGWTPRRSPTPSGTWTSAS